MVDESQRPMSTSSFSLEQLLRYYEAGDDIGLALEKAYARSHDLMRQYPQGVPTSVMIATQARSIKWASSFLSNLIVENRGLIDDMSDEEVGEQQRMTQAVLELIISHAQNAVFEAFVPPKEEQ